MYLYKKKKYNIISFKYKNQFQCYNLQPELQQ